MYNCTRENIFSTSRSQKATTVPVATLRANRLIDNALRLNLAPDAYYWATIRLVKNVIVRRIVVGTTASLPRGMLSDHAGLKTCATSTKRYHKTQDVAQDFSPAHT